MGGRDGSSDGDDGSALKYIVSGTMAGFVQVAVGEKTNKEPYVFLCQKLCEDAC